MFYKTTGSVTVYLVLTREYVNQEYIKNNIQISGTEQGIQKQSKNSFENLEQYRRKGDISNH